MKDDYKITFGYKSPLNVLTYGYYWNWMYPDSWWRCIKQFFRNIKYAYQRIVRGYCDWDTWDLDEYYCNLFYSSINYLAENTYGYPGVDEFPTPESWDKYLKEMANHFKYASSTYENECYPKYAVAFNNWHGGDNGWDTLNQEERQMCGEKEYHYHMGFNMIDKVFKHLWD